ncbi:MAG TPA: pteridine reductase [Steroidobacteraceae bacterium]|nr:pteridine reductase [Steroidobacteraceae bacterium]
MDYPLHGQVALVTGAARRVGAAIVRELHAAGAAVMIHCHHSRAAAALLASELNQHRAGSAEVIGADLLQSDELPNLVSATLEVFGGLDILVNNASTFYPTPLGGITGKEWDDLIGSNLKAPLFLAQAAAPALRESRGLLLNIADIHGLRPLGGHPVYSVAKAGLIMLTRSLARELAPEVRVNAIAPGPVLWPEASMEPERQQRILEHTLLKRAGSPTDIARTVRFFAVDAPYVTGQILAVDGGRSVSA